MQKILNFIIIFACGGMVVASIGKLAERYSESETNPCQSCQEQLSECRHALQESLPVLDICNKIVDKFLKQGE